MRELLVLLLFASAASCSLAPEAAANPWARGADRTFVSIAHEWKLGDADTTPYTSVYAERGLDDRLTLGIDGGFTQRSGPWEAILFARHPISELNGIGMLSIDFGIGVRVIDNSETGVARSGIAVGRGFQTRWGDGWLALAGSYSAGFEGSGLGKLDGTLGFNRPNGSLAILQIQTEKADGKRGALTLASSYVHPLTKTMMLQFGASYDLQNDVLAPKIGVWFEF